MEAQQIKNQLDECNRKYTQIETKQQIAAETLENIYRKYNVHSVDEMHALMVSETAKRDELLKEIENYVQGCLEYFQQVQGEI